MYLFRQVFSYGIFLFFVLFFVSIGVKAQKSKGGIPPSFKQTTLRNSVPVQEVDVDFVVDDLKKEDIENEGRGLPLRVSKIIPVNFNADNSGNWILLPDGQEIWQLSLKAPEAIACMLYYDEFYIPEGGRLFIYNADKTHVLGAYNHATNPSGMAFATEFISGDEFTLEYVKPEIRSKNDEKPVSIRISGLAYGYNHLDAYRVNSLRANNSGSCEVNINCEEGDLWQHYKKGIAKTVARIGNSNYICSGSLVNNTSGQIIPYFLSAHHCFYSEGKTAAFNTMIFYFHYEYPECENLTLNPGSKTMVGAELLVDVNLVKGSDGVLLQLSSSVPEDYGVFYNGWNANNIAPESGVCIHHPEGDPKKISTYTSRARSATWNSIEGRGATNAHWSATFVKTANGHGVTEGGSSGSPMFDQNGRITGTLSGGSSSCSITSGANLFGKLWYHWDQVDTAQMKKYLDPQQTGLKVLNGRYSDPLFIDFTSDKQTIYSGESISFENKSYGYTSVLWSFPGGTPSSSSLENPIIQYKTSGKYDVTLTISNDADSRTETYTGYVTVDMKNGQIIPGSLTVNLENNRTVSLDWDAFNGLMSTSQGTNVSVANEDTIRWDSGSIMRSSGIQGGGTYSILSAWTPEDLPGYNTFKIKSVLLYITNKSFSYTLKIYNDGVEIYSLPLSNLTSSQYNRIDLASPLEINLSGTLLVGYEVTQSGDDRPIATDTGPLASGKNFVLYMSDLHESSTLGFTGNWRIATIIEEIMPPEFTYSVYRNDQLLVSGLNESSYTDTDMPGHAETFCYRVSTVYSINEESEQSDKVCISIPTGIDKVTDSAGQIELYPNPMTDQLHITTHGAKIVSVMVTDVNGRLLYQGNPKLDDHTLMVDTWAKGIYFVKVTTITGRSVYKMIKK